MRRSLLACRILTFALATTAIALAGCPAAPDQPLNPPPVSTESAPDVEPSSVPSPDVGTPDADVVDPTAAAAGPLDGEATSPPPIGDVDPAPAVAIERPSDFLRPTLPDAALQAQVEEEPADPPEAVTDRSAEAEDPNVLPGGTPVGDLFEGLEEKPSGDSND